MTGNWRRGTYPLARPRSGDDPNFTRGLLWDVARRIEEQGYPKIESGPDLVRLHLALFRFVYGGEEGER